jgi:putative oxidoreductase
MAMMMGMSVLAVYILASMETMAGVLILAGGLKKDWATRLAGLLVIPVMIGAIMMLHAGQWSFMPTEQFPAGGMEFQVVLLVLSLYFLVKGNEIE